MGKDYTLLCLFFPVSFLIRWKENIRKVFASNSYIKKIIGNSLGKIFY